MTGVDDVQSHLVSKNISMGFEGCDVRFRSSGIGLCD